MNVLYLERLYEALQSLIRLLLHHWDWDGRSGRVFGNNVALPFIIDDKLPIKMHSLAYANIKGNQE
jgi:hypothetical protein